MAIPRLAVTARLALVFKAPKGPCVQAAPGREISRSPPRSGGLHQIAPEVYAETGKMSSRSGRDDSPGRVSILPPYRLRRPIVLSHIRHEFVCQVFHRSENSARDNSTLKLGKP